MKAFLKILLLLITFFGLYSDDTRISLNPNEIDEFVMDPADFDENNGSGSVWQLAPFGRKDPTIYTRDKRDDGTPIIRAVSDNSISSVKVNIDADPNDFPVIEWQWWIENVLESGDLTKKDGDDYAARIYITFDYPTSELSFGDRVKHRFYRTFTSFDVPTRALNYIWANKAEVGTIAPNPFTDWVQMVAVQSGNEHAGEWKSERRNIVEDYKAAFGEKPPRITGIQIMTDSDNTGESAHAAYGSIILRKE